MQYGVLTNPNQFQLSITDNTSNQTYTTYKTLATALRSSAEWIAEAPTAGGIVPLPEFGSVPFTSSWATIDSTTGAIDDPSWQVTQVNMYNPTWGDSMSPSATADVGSGTSAQSSFTVYQTPESSTTAGSASAAAALALWAFVSGAGGVSPPARGGRSAGRS